MAIRRVMLLFGWALLQGACTDVFELPIGAGVDLGRPGLDGFIEPDDSAGASGGSDGSDLGLGADGPTVLLPSSCAQLSCTPAGDEGDVDLASGSLSGCHAYDRLTIGVQVRATRAGSMGFAACANTIIITGVLTANGEGEAGGAGSGAGATCGSGGGHGGLGADGDGCTGGASYGDSTHPRELGSGGGGSGGGSGGGAIELVADSINVIGFITANGEDGEAASGASAGGGAGGSILLSGGTILGAGSLQAHGGKGSGTKGGGGGGGRIAVYSGPGSVAGLPMDVKGGESTGSTPSGVDGSSLRTP